MDLKECTCAKMPEIQPVIFWGAINYQAVCECGRKAELHAWPEGAKEEWNRGNYFTERCL